MKRRRRIAQLHDRALMTTGDVARYLELTRRGVNWLVATGRLEAYEETVGGQRIFRLGEIRQYARDRADRRLAPAERRVNPVGQLPLPLRAKPPAVSKPWSWRLAKFRPRMAKVVLPDREVNPRVISKVKGRVA